jgi:hypothetical protein
MPAPFAPANVWVQPPVGSPTRVVSFRRLPIMVLTTEIIQNLPTTRPYWIGEREQAAVEIVWRLDS